MRYRLQSRETISYWSQRNGWVYLFVFPFTIQRPSNERQRVSAAAAAAASAMAITMRFAVVDHELQVSSVVCCG